MSNPITGTKWDGRVFDIGKMHVSCDRCKEPITARYGWNGNSMVCEPCLSEQDRMTVQ